MASSPAPIRFRPMPLPELLDELFRLYRRHFSLIIAVALLVALPGLIWQLVTGTYRLNSSSYANLFTTTGSSPPVFNRQQLSDLVGAYTLAAIGAVILLPITVGAVTRAVTDVALGRPATIGSVLAKPSLVTGSCSVSSDSSSCSESAGPSLLSSDLSC